MTVIPMDSNTKDIFVFLKGIDLFQDLTQDAIANYVKNIIKIQYPIGSFVLKQGEVAESLYIVKSGVIEGAYWDQYQLKIPLLRFHTRDYFGDLSLMSNKPSQLGYQTLEDSEIFSFPAPFLMEILAAYPSVGHRFFHRIAEKHGILAEKLHMIMHRQVYLKSIMKNVEEEAPFYVGQTKVMNQLWQDIPKMATDAHPIMIIGEFGVGKELVAEIIHNRGPMRNRPFITIDASEITEEDWQEGIWEKDLSQGPISKIRFGFQDLAGGGTLFLKNIDALSPPLQKKLEDFLSMNRHGERDKLSSHHNPAVDLPGVRIILTAHSDPAQNVQEGSFSPRLYEIISKRIICLPPLRERKRDILDLADHFMEKHSKRYKKNVHKLSPRAKEQLLSYNYYRGNIQELDEIIERGVVLTTSDTMRSEQLFLGPPAGRAHIWCNLLKIKAFEKMVRKGIYPGIFRWIAVAFFFLIMLACFWGPQDYTKNWGTILVWWIWWPWLCAAAFWIGRTWCSFCAYATLGNTLQKRLQLNLKFPKFFKNNDYVITTFFFLFVVWVEEATYMRYYPVYTGLLLSSILVMELLFSILFQRDTWCRHVCPMGNLIGLFAMTSIVEVRANMDICTNQCTTHECYHGTKDQEGCPMFQHLMFVDNNQTCKLCLNCIRTCPHQSVSLNLRPPGWEIWASNQVRPGMAIFVCALMGVLFPMLKRFDSLFLTTLAYLVAPLLMIGLIWMISFIEFHGVKGAVYGGFWKATYAYVPLALTAHIAYQLQFIPWLKGLNYTIFLDGRALMSEGSWLHLAQAVFLGLGILFALYAIFRITREKLSLEGHPRFFFWVGHGVLIILYAFLIGYLLR